MNIGGSAADLRFLGAMDRAMGSATGSVAEQRVWNALASVPANALSGSERQAVVTLTSTLAADGNVSEDEATELVSLIDAYGGNPTAALDGAGAFVGPFVRGELARYAGNALYAGVVGQLATAIGGRNGDTLVQAAAAALLNDVQPNAAETALRFAFNNADLSQLSAPQKQSLLTMLAVAAGDGHIDNAEARAVLDQLDRGLDAPAFTQSLPPQGGAMQITSSSNGQATIDLGDGYSLKLNENASELVLVNGNTGTTTDISGDPHVYVDGKHVGDFYGTTTLVLDNGTKITVNTVPYANNPNAYLSSSLTITKGDQLIVVQGLDQNTKGDMTVSSYAQGGYLADWGGNDGLQLYENPNGGGWVVRDGLTMHAVTQQDFDTTKPGSLINSGEYSVMGLLFAASLMGFALNLGMVAGLAWDAGEAVESARALHNLTR
jgi:hypothetical protein